MKKINLRRINQARERHERVMKELRRKKREEKERQRLEAEKERWVKFNQDLMEAPMFWDEPSLIERLWNRFFRQHTSGKCDFEDRPDCGANVHIGDIENLRSKANEYV